MRGGGVVQCYSPTLPTHKRYREPQFAHERNRSFNKIVPFMGLKCGEHDVRFYNDAKEITVTIKVWFSLYVDAWKIIRVINKLSNVVEEGD